MNFFEAQHQARKRTHWLVLWFVLGVMGTVAVLFGASYFLQQFLYDDRNPLREDTLSWKVAVAGGVIVLLGSMFKLIQLGQGGAVVARDMGARPVDPSTRDIDERRLWNVVQEMAIASGIPAPEVWVMDGESSINAFAAGTEPGNAVVAVSQGCLKQLTRAELQGVVAHEFSHILNGDMRLNVRLIGWLFGLMMIAMVGRGILSVLQHTRIRSSSDNKNSSGLLLVVVVSGVLLWLVGSVGVFFGRLIQAAVSRQREYLADASAVQFTRDPSGISGALKKILAGGHASLIAPKSAEAAHMFFSSSGGFFSGLLATHPPLPARIKAIDPAWDGRVAATAQPTVEEREMADMPAIATRRQWQSAALSGIGSAASIKAAYGEEVLRSLQQQGVVETTSQAKGLILGLLVAQDETLREEEMVWLKGDIDSEEMQAVVLWQSRSLTMSSVQKISMIDLAIPLLRRMSLSEFENFRDIARQLIKSDGEVSLFEFMMERAIERHLASSFVRRDVAPMRWKYVSEVESELALLVSCLCSVSDNDNIHAWNAVVEEYYSKSKRQLQRVAADFSLLDAAFAKLDAATPPLKREIIQLCGLAVMNDSLIEDREIELLRALADAIGTSLPPLQALR